MAETSYEFLTDFFCNHLSFTPTPSQIVEFQIDLSLVSPYLMEAALVEVKRGRQGQLIRHNATSWRPAIFKVYNRKVAEHAQLFCIFHTFETAFRSSVAVLLEKHYQHKRWWRKIYSEMKLGNSAATVRLIGTTHISRDAAYTIGQIINEIDYYQPGTIEGLTNGYQFLECCDLKHIAKLIDKHWFLFAPMFTKGIKQLSRADFYAKFDRIRRARNDVYHHKSVARTTGIVTTAEEMLDYLNFSLHFVFNKIMDARPTKLIFAVAIDPGRHHTWAD
jgi:hypothetical protein